MAQQYYSNYYGYPPAPAERKMALVTESFLYQPNRDAVAGDALNFIGRKPCRMGFGPSFAYRPAAPPPPIYPVLRAVPILPSYQ